MSLATVRARAQNGLVADEVVVEVHLGNGLPALNIVGLPEAAVREAKDRVRAALTVSGFSFPQQRITINLAPADLPKFGGRFDLPIALGILLAQQALPAGCLDDLEVLGELSLSGEIRPVPGALPASLQATESGRGLILPADNLAEARLCRAAALHPMHHLSALVAALHQGTLTPADTPAPTPASQLDAADLADVRGQHQAKRALEIAAAGGHSLRLIGPPGAGKSMLAARLPGLLPPLTEAEALSVASIRSISHEGFDARLWGQRPYRAPHHTASGVALVGGGAQPRPGEITLAHHGVLFLDELPEFPRAVLDVLREPLESGVIDISRAARKVRFPAQFQLVAAMNPCPCGHLGDPRGQCRCMPDQVSRYQGRLSGPLLDRIDLHVTVPRVDETALLDAAPRDAERTSVVQQRTTAARDRQLARQGKSNAAMSTREIDQHVPLDTACRALLQRAVEQLGLTARGLHRVIKVGRTIADLAGDRQVTATHIAEALRYRAP